MKKFSVFPSFRLQKLQIESVNLKSFFPVVSYRSLAYVATLLTGFASLCAQVAWQKYLTILVGSETRSISLVIAIFLLGLAAGYYVFGKLTEKKWSRWQFLKFYGWVELFTALYISCFYIYFDFLRVLSFNSPAHLIVDVGISFLALFPPTFLMGASLPALTATLPEESKEVNSVHIRIYGWNTLGAFLGILVSGFYFLSTFGLAFTLTIAGILNAIAALVFMGNRLEGDVHQQQKEPPQYPSRIPNKIYMISAFLTGAVVISFEVLFVRLLNVSVGAGVYNFPIILSLFVGGLALGSLSIRQRDISAGFFINQILITVILLVVLFFWSPYWSIWIAHIRVSLISIPSNYIVFKTVQYLFLFLMLFPAVFFMGRLLPLTYALLKKNENNYGSFCGYLYFFNTLGTVAGTLVIGYLAFYIFNLDDLFRINVVLLLVLTVAAAIYEKRKFVISVSFLLIVCACLLPSWNRVSHHLGYFRDRAPQSTYFKKVFFLPKKYKGDVLFFNDGPNVSTTLIGHKNEKISSEVKALVPSGEYSSISFVVNGKSIGRTLGGDFSTMFLLSGLGYFYAPEREKGLSSAVIGLGTGISAGLMGKLEKSREVTVLEIAPEVVENVRRSPSFNFGLNSNRKIKIIAQDGFKYFTKTRKKFDVILSEPSNPWIVGVENVFSYEFYELAKSSLTEDGVLIQWAQLYSIDFETLSIMFHTLQTVFPYAKLYRIGVSDIAIVASPKPLNFSRERFFDPVLMPYQKAMGFYEPEDISLAQVFSEDVFSRIALSNKFGVHTLISPKLAYRGDKTFFIGKTIQPENMRPAYFFNPSHLEDLKTKAFKKYSSLSQEQIRKKCVPEIGFLCGILIPAIANNKIFEDKKKPSLVRFKPYDYLRKRGLARHDSQFLETLKNEIIEKNIKNGNLLFSYLSHVSGGKQYEKARNDLALFYKKGLLPEKVKSTFEKHLQTVEKELTTR